MLERLMYKELEFQVILGSIVRPRFKKPRPTSIWMLWSVRSRLHLVE